MDIQAAKKLLKKAIEIGDEELIDMANQTLNNILGDTKQEEKKPVKAETPKKVDNGEFIFKMENETKANTAITRNGTPVNAIQNRVNKFHDDGTEAKDITTPEVSLTERKRPPFKKIEQICQKCSSSVMINPAHKRDYFICDRCIPK